MDISSVKNSAKDYILEDVPELEVSTTKKSRYAAAIDESDDEEDLDDGFSDFEISDSDYHSIYDDTH